MLKLTVVGSTSSYIVLLELLKEIVQWVELSGTWHIYTSMNSSRITT